MKRSGWQATARRLAVLLLVPMLATVALAAAFAAAGRPTAQAIAAGSGLVGIAIVLLGTVLLGLARRADGRVTQLTGLGTLALGVPFLVLALVV